ncbi:hypothetical protein ZOSMA_279G00180 [Zostera marina]|uniref:MLO-like protein n=1 Tax=Zostera marina TaxID=29655 RepID=A0A0K9PDT8_ZOSMR|nr:hypothetical protein ZOSMA_279G00180 [Zostera marina]
MGTDGEGGSNVRRLDQTSTWSVASVCVVIIVISIILEKALHNLGQWFVRKRKTALFDALEKVKDELMILGFISLLMTFCRNYIAKICIPEKVADTMLPCALKPDTDTVLVQHLSAETTSIRRVLSYDVVSTCQLGKVPLVSINGLHQLHIFIFFLAMFHVFYSAVTMVLGRAKIRRWKEWENETTTICHEYSNASSRFRFAHETSFVRKHTSSWNKTPILLYTASTRVRVM